MAGNNIRNSRKNKKVNEAVIPVFLQLLPDDDGVGETDQRVVITVNGENKIIPRGERVYVTPEEYEILFNSGRLGHM